MRLEIITALLLSVGTVSINAQNLEDIQIHGFATQSFAVSDHNNFIGMDTSQGSTDWTEAALNINDQVTEKLRVGVQLHYTRLGTFGGDSADVDWALGDYKIDPKVNIRAGKVKLRFGLYNDTQDYDPGYLWSLLPESTYGIDIRATNLSQNGIELYGNLPLNNAGQLEYSVYDGYYTFASNDGTAEAWREAGDPIVGQPYGKSFGFDTRWHAPTPGLKLGGSLNVYNAKGTTQDGTFTQPLMFWDAFYAQYDQHKIFASGQFSKVVSYATTQSPGSPAQTSGDVDCAWFVMGGYHLTDRLQAGAYFDRFYYGGADTSDPANYLNSWVVSTRYDIDQNFYVKAEGHFMKGYGDGFYSIDNPNGFDKNTNLFVAKVGFTF